MDDIESIISREAIDFEEAEKFFKERVPITAKEFYAMEAKYRSLAFTVSGYTKATVLKAFYDKIESAVTEGTTMAAFRGEMNDFLRAEGYKGLTPFQAENIFRTNVQTAYSVGHYEQMTNPLVQKLRPYWQYNAVEDKHTRPAHRAMNGKVFPADSPVWDVWYPPNGFKCRCTVTSLSERQVRERGLKIETEVPGVGTFEGGRSAVILPDPKFDTNPAKVRFTPDMQGYPEAIKKAYEKHEKGNPAK